MTVSRVLNHCLSPVQCTCTRSLVRVTRETQDSRKNSAEVHGRSKPTPAAVASLAQEIVADGRFEPAIEKLFANRDVEYVQVNSTTAGCFTFRIERA